MPDIQEMEDRLKRLEAMSARPEARKPEARLEAGGGEHEIVEGKEKITNIDELSDRIQELEDLLLLIEMENTRIKEKIIGSANAETPVDILDRVQKLEEKVAETKESDTEGLEKKIDDLEEYVSKELSALDKRLAGLEDRPHERPQIKVEKIEQRRIEKPQTTEEDNKLLGEVMKILER